MIKELFLMKLQQLTRKNKKIYEIIQPIKK